MFGDRALAATTAFFLRVKGNGRSLLALPAHRRTHSAREQQKAQRISNKSSITDAFSLGSSPSQSTRVSLMCLWAALPVVTKPLLSKETVFQKGPGQRGGDTNKMQRGCSPSSSQPQTHPICLHPPCSSYCPSGPIGASHGLPLFHRGCSLVQSLSLNSPSLGQLPLQ